MSIKVGIARTKSGMIVTVRIEEFRTSVSSIFDDIGNNDIGRKSETLGFFTFGIQACRYHNSLFPVFGTEREEIENANGCVSGAASTSRADFRR